MQGEVASRIEFFRAMQQAYPAINVTRPCTYILKNAATWVRELQASNKYRMRFLRNNEALVTKIRLIRRRICEWQRTCFPNHVATFNADSRKITIHLGLIPVPTSRKATRT